ncbi:hypothetical protein AB0J51_19140 [Micromonospora echinofusca]|uniref:hypothetical protein n=1 Tax=Micromonospora echinofusca TaxID=47858 RepID=UPI0034331392
MSSEELSALAQSLGASQAPAPLKVSVQKWKLAVAAAVGGVFLFGAGLATGAVIFRPSGQAEGGEEGATILIAAKEKCSLSEYATIGDGGKSLTLDSGGKEDLGLDYSDIECILKEVRAPDHVVSEMASTRALDGKQNARWGKVRASWTYHPDQGLDVILVTD